MVKDLHEKPFDKDTLTKLEIFDRYVEAWLPTFINSPYTEINICDFFAGPGTDCKGVLGSPLKIIENILKYKDSIIAKQKKINIIFNEFVTNKYTDLKANVERYSNDLKGIHIEIYNEDFKNLFNKLKSRFAKTPSLLFLDQNGVKQITHDVILELDSFTTTDFLFFISSSYITRFKDDFKKILPNIDTFVINSEYLKVHHAVIDYYRQLIPKTSKLKLYPFAIKKDINVYGLIFGSHHPRAWDKFLDIAWDKNKLTGDANFSTDEDIQTDLFGTKMLKIDSFKADLEKLILRKKHITNIEIYDYTLSCGHIPTHAIDKLKELRENKVLEHYSYEKINYSACYSKKKDIVTFEVKK